MEAFLWPLILKILDKFAFSTSHSYTHVHTQLFYTHIVLTNFNIFMSIGNSQYLITVYLLQYKFHQLLNLWTEWPN